MTEEEFKLRLNTQTLINQEFINLNFSYWLMDDKEAKTPFPPYMYEELQEKTFKEFMKWVFIVDDNDQDITEEELCEKFEEVIKDIAFKLAKNKDDILSIKYINYPAKGELVRIDRDGEKIIARTAFREEVYINGKKYLKYLLQADGGKTTWEELYELKKKS